MKVTRLAQLANRIAASNFSELPLPYRLTFAVTNRCQARCAMCNIWTKPTEDELTVDDIATLFRSANHFSWINLTGGELFQRGDIQTIISGIIHSSPRLYLLNFPTNGMQTDSITEAVDHILNETPLPRLIVSVSLDGPESTHDRVRGVDGCWKKALQTFSQLRLRTSGRFSVYLGYTIQKANLGLFPQTIVDCSCKTGISLTANDFHINLAHSSPHYYENSDSDVIPDAMSALREFRRAYSMRNNRVLNPVSYIEKRYQQSVEYYLKTGRSPYQCKSASTSCFIDPTGKLYPCTVYNHKIGSLKDFGMDFKALWNSQDRRSLRREIKHSRCPGCWTPCEAYQTILGNLIQL